uniref:Malonyl-CoA:ACP transacylase (MAT) domain-containing protein n=1 Tax=Alexandrium monilatum TaxID=311494 RepID=A0A7S4Q9K0_9DINO
MAQASGSHRKPLPLHCIASATLLPAAMAGQEEEDGFEWHALPGIFPAAAEQEGAWSWFVRGCSALAEQMRQLRLDHDALRAEVRGCRAAESSLRQLWSEHEALRAEVKRAPEQGHGGTTRWANVSDCTASKRGSAPELPPISLAPHRWASVPCGTLRPSQRRSAVDPKRAEALPDAQLSGEDCAETGRQQPELPRAPTEPKPASPQARAPDRGPGGAIPGERRGGAEADKLRSALPKPPSEPRPAPSEARAQRGDPRLRTLREPEGHAVPDVTRPALSGRPLEQCFAVPKPPTELKPTAPETRAPNPDHRSAMSTEEESCANVEAMRSSLPEMPPGFVLAALEDAIRRWEVGRTEMDGAVQVICSCDEGQAETNEVTQSSSPEPPCGFTQPPRAPSPVPGQAVLSSEDNFPKVAHVHGVDLEHVIRKVAVSELPAGYTLAHCVPDLDRVRMMRSWHMSRATLDGVMRSALSEPPASLTCSGEEGTAQLGLPPASSPKVLAGLTCSGEGHPGGADLPPASSPVVPAAPTLPAALLFPGESSRYVGMLKDVAGLPAVREMLATAEELLGWDVEDVCLRGPAEKLGETRYCQPAVFVACLAAMEALRATREDVVERAQVVAGVGTGEYAAICAAGILSFEDCLRLVKLRAEVELQHPGLDPLCEAIEEALPRMRPPRCCVYLSATGTKVAPGTPPSDFVDLMKRPASGEALCEPAIREMIADGVKDFYECGKLKQLKAMMLRIDREAFKRTESVPV